MRTPGWAARLRAAHEPHPITKEAAQHPSTTNDPAWMQALPESATDEDEVNALVREALEPRGAKNVKAVPALLTRKGRAQLPMNALADTVAYTRHLQQHRDAILTADDMDTLWRQLLAAAEAPTDGAAQPDEEKRISFAGFQAARRALPEKCARYFSASVFVAFGPDASGTVPVLQFFGYVLRRSSLLNARLDLAMYDQDMDGALTEDELQAYLADLLPSLHLASMKPSFYKFYLCTAARKLCFYLDPLRRGRVAIRDLILSPILTELFVLREPEIPREFEGANWFSTASAMRVYTQFMALDTDRNGMLSRAEMSRFAAGAFTGAFLDRVFQEHQTYNGEMDYRTFLDFVLAYEALPHVQQHAGGPNASAGGASFGLFGAAGAMPAPAAAFYFRLLDMGAHGALTSDVLFYFLRDMTAKLRTWGAPAPHIDTLVHEVFDLIGPSVPGRITLSDMLRTGTAGIVIGLLIDVNAFTAYENRESS